MGRVTLKKINHGFTTNKTKKNIVTPCHKLTILIHQRGFCSKTVVIQIVINTTKKHGYTLLLQ